MNMSALIQGQRLPARIDPNFLKVWIAENPGGAYGDADKKSPKGKDPDRSSDTGGQPPEKVDDRSNVSKVQPEDYPHEKRKNSS